MIRLPTPSLEIRAIGYRVGSSAASAGMQAAFILLFARSIGPAEFAPFGQFLSLCYLFGAAVSFGFGVQALRLGDSNEARRILGTMLSVRLASALVLTSVVGLVLNFAIGLPVGLGLAAGLLMVNEMMSELIQNGLSGQDRQNYGSRLMVSQRVIGSLLPIGAHSFGLPWWIALLLGQTVVLIRFCKVSLRIAGPPANLLRVMRESVPFWVSTSVGNLYQADVSITRAILGPVASGAMSVGSRISTPLALVSAAVLSVFLPKFSRAARDGHSAADDLKRLVFASSCLALITICSAPFIAECFLLVVGSQYKMAYWYYVSVVIAAAIGTVSQVLQAYSYSFMPARVVSRIVAIGVAIGLLSLFVGLTSAGLLGAAAGPLAMQISILAQYSFLLSEGRRRRAKELVNS